MVQTTTTEIAAESLSDEALLEAYAQAQALAKSWADKAGRIEWEMRKRMEGRGAMAIPSDTFICELQPRSTYDQTSFTPLKEILMQTDLIECLEPAHEETRQVPDKWNTAKVKAAARRYGHEAQRIVDQATRPDVPKLKVQRREDPES